MSLLHNSDVYQSTNQKTDRKHPEYGFVLALIGVALALVLVSITFPDAFGPSGGFSIFGP
jgi:hypothetical protein